MHVTGAHVIYRAFLSALKIEKFFRKKKKKKKKKDIFKKKHFCSKLDCAYNMNAVSDKISNGWVQTT